MGTTVILHVGLPKTGSTALQQFLVANRSALQQEGVAYHKLPGARSECHWWFALPFLERYSDYAPAKAELDSGVSQSALTERGRKSAQAFLEELSSYSKVIVSAEQFFFLPRSALARIRRFLKEKGCSVQVAAYVRNPVDACRSEINQSVKMGRTDLKTASKNLPVIRLRERLREIVDVFGMDSVFVRSVSTEALSEGDVRSDFIRYVAGLNWTKFQYVKEDLANRSLCFEALIMADEFNKLSRLPSGHIKERVRFLKSLEEIDGIEFCLDKESIGKVLEKCADDLTYLKNNWGIEFEDIESYRI